MLKSKFSISTTILNIIGEKMTSDETVENIMEEKREKMMQKEKETSHESEKHGTDGTHRE